MSFKIIYRLHLSKNTRHYSVPRLHLMGELAAAPPLTEGEKPISQNQSKLAVIRNVRYLSFRHRDKSRCHLPFSSRVLLAARDQPGRILRMPVRRCRNPLRGSSVRVIRGRQNYDQSTLKNAKPPICFRYKKFTQFGSTTSIFPRIMPIQQL